MADNLFRPVYNSSLPLNLDWPQPSSPYEGGNLVFENAREKRRRRALVTSFLKLDRPLLTIVGLLLAVGMMMVYSTTFDWSFATRGNPTAIFVQDHLRNVVIGLVGMMLVARVDYRFWRRFSIVLLLITIGALLSVWLFGEETFGARRSLIDGRFQPGELAEFTMIFYMAAWLSSKHQKIQNVAQGLLPFGLLVGTIAGFVALQPDFSSAAVITITASSMYFLAGGRVSHLIVGLTIAMMLGLFFVQNQSYAQQRINDFNSSAIDLTNANYHTQQAVIAFLNGGWTGAGIGQGQQKFGFLPAPHTDSIFAVIGEELGVLGAAAVILLFIAFAFRGYVIASRSADSFGALLVAGFTTWVILRALLNIAVMTGRVPSSGVPLPFVSFGGSALLVLMLSVGLILSVQRVAAARNNKKSRRNAGANYDWGWGNRRARLPRTRRYGGPARAQSRRG